MNFSLTQIGGFSSFFVSAVIFAQFCFSVANALNAIVQMNQVKFTCTYDSFEAFQKDGKTALTISEGDMVDNIDKSISESLRDQVE